MKIPAWAMKEEKYEPTRDRDYFISRSLLRVMRVLFSFQQQARRPDGNRISAVAALCFLIGWLVLTVSAHRGAFLLCQLAFELLLLCLLDGRALRQLLGNALATSVFSAFLVLPAIWLGNGSNVLLIPCKTFLTVAALGLLTRFLPWNQLTAAMRVFHLPQVVIFIFDTTLRYIVLLGEIAGEMLTALKLRSIGHNPHKGRAISGILGVMFLRSREMSEEMYQAMVCRGYTGEYLVAAARGRHRGGFWLALLFLLFVVLYLRIEVLL